MKTCRLINDCRPSLTVTNRDGLQLAIVWAVDVLIKLFGKKKKKNEELKKNGSNTLF